jgi:dinuclear metal center YbgI/SA1388 family protein
MSQLRGIFVARWSTLKGWRDRLCPPDGFGAHLCCADYCSVLRHAGLLRPQAVTAPGHQIPQNKDMTDRSQLLALFDALLEPQRFKDYGPNGLQVEGRHRVRKLVSGVSASLALIEAAIACDADALLVHHGLFWRGQDGRVTGWMKQRLSLLLRHELNLFAYHLPLDAHPELGNNAQLAKRLGFACTGRFGDQDLGFKGACLNGSAFAGPQQLSRHLHQVLQREPLHIGPEQGQIRALGWCTGGAQGYFEAAIHAGVDAFITGEVSEPQAHYARECGVHYFACGHHATERFGVQAMGAQVAQQFGLAHEFIDIYNPA